MRSNGLSRGVALIAAAVLTILLTVAGARPAAATTTPPSIINQIAGLEQLDGTYLWQYQITGGSQPALSHWVLSTCEDVFDSLVPGSVTGTDASKISFVINDQKTGATGIKFDEGFDDGEVRTISFRLTEDWAPVTTTASMKSGSDVLHLSVVGPSCEKTTAPEAGTAHLVLAAAALPLSAMVLRRRRRKSPGA